MACTKETVIVREVVSEHPFWPLQKYYKWVYSGGANVTQEVVLGPLNAANPPYFPFEKAPFPPFVGLRLSPSGDLEIVWKHMDVTWSGVFLPKKLPADTARWNSPSIYFYRVDPRAGIPVYDSIRFQIRYAGLIPNYTPSPGPSAIYEWVADIYIRTEIWHIFEERWMDAALPEYRLILDENIGPIVLRSNTINRHLLEAVVR